MIKGFRRRFSLSNLFGQASSETKQSADKNVAHVNHVAADTRTNSESRSQRNCGDDVIQVVGTTATQKQRGESRKWNHHLNRVQSHSVAQENKAATGATTAEEGHKEQQVWHRTHSKSANQKETANHVECGMQCRKTTTRLQSRNSSTDAQLDERELNEKDNTIASPWKKNPAFCGNSPTSFCSPPPLCVPSEAVSAYQSVVVVGDGKAAARFLSPSSMNAAPSPHTNNNNGDSKLDALICRSSSVCDASRRKPAPPSHHKSLIFLPDGHGASATPFNYNYDVSGDDNNNSHSHHHYQQQQHHQQHHQYVNAGGGISMLLANHPTSWQPIASQQHPHHPANHHLLTLCQHHPEQQPPHHHQLPPHHHHHHHQFRQLQKHKSINLVLREEDEEASCVTSVSAGGASAIPQSATHVKCLRTPFDWSVSAASSSSNAHVADAADAVKGGSASRWRRSIGGGEAAIAAVGEASHAKLGRPPPISAANGLHQLEIDPGQLAKVRLRRPATGAGLSNAAQQQQHNSKQEILSSTHTSSSKLRNQLSAEFTGGVSNSHTKRNILYQMSESAARSSSALPACHTRQQHREGAQLAAAAASSPLFSPPPLQLGPRQQHTMGGSSISPLYQPAFSGQISRRSRRFSLSEIGFGKMESYEKLEKLGEGTYATVYKGRSRLTENLVALKEIRLEHDEGAPCTAIREVSLLRNLRHVNIVILHDIIYSTSSQFLSLVFEFVEQDLKQFMDKHCACEGSSATSATSATSTTSATSAGSERFISMQKAVLFVYQLMRGLAFCHQRHILHRDLKPQNLLITARGDLKLADFGLARAKSIPSKSFSHDVVTLWYRPPDVLLGSKDYSTHIDMWAVGCIFYELVQNRPLFPGNSVTEQLELIFRTLGYPNESSWPQITSHPNYQRDPWPTKLPVNSSISGFPIKKLSPRLSQFPAGTQLLYRLLLYNISERVSATQALRCDVFSDQHYKHHCDDLAQFMYQILDDFVITGSQLSSAATLTSSSSHLTSSLSPAANGSQQQQQQKIHQRHTIGIYPEGFWSQCLQLGNEQSILDVTSSPLPVAKHEDVRFPGGSPMSFSATSALNAKKKAAMINSFSSSCCSTSQRQSII